MTAPSRTAAPARLASVAAALALLATMIVRPALGPAGARAMGPLPDCRYADILTTPRSYADWSITLVDTILRVPKAYVPPDLVSTAQAGIKGGGKVRAVVIDDLRGDDRGRQSGRERHRRRERVSLLRVPGRTCSRAGSKRYGYDRALEVSARPGHSEHQLGLAIDFRSEPGGSPFTGTWGTTPAGKWMKAHAWEYGWVMSYPKGTMALTCYDYEPWHFRYVGRDLAALIHESGLTPREYLWANFTTTVVPPPPPPTKAPTKSPKPTAAPAATATVEPSLTPAPTVSPDPTVPPTATPAPTATPPPPTPPPTPIATAAPRHRANRRLSRPPQPRGSPYCSGSWAWGRGSRVAAATRAAERRIAR